MKIHIHGNIQDRAKGCTPVDFLFALQMKYARTMADTTSKATTTEVTKITVLFLDAVIFLLHVLLLESCLKYIRQQGQSLLWEGELSWLEILETDIQKFTSILMGKRNIKKKIKT
jgi:hypothetical protein